MNYSEVKETLDKKSLRIQKLKSVIDRLKSEVARSKMESLYLKYPKNEAAFKRYGYYFKDRIKFRYLNEIREGVIVGWQHEYWVLLMNKDGLPSTKVMRVSSRRILCRI